MHHSPVPIQQILIVPAVFSKHSKVLEAVHTFASVLCYVNILCHLIRDMKLTYLIVGQKTTSRFAAGLWYRHFVSHFHYRDRRSEFFLSCEEDESPGRFNNP